MQRSYSTSNRRCIWKCNSKFYWMGFGFVIRLTGGNRSCMWACTAGKDVKTVNLVGFSHEESSEQTHFSTCWECVFFLWGLCKKLHFCFSVLLSSVPRACRNTKFTPTNTLIIYVRLKAFEIRLSQRQCPVLEPADSHSDSWEQFCLCCKPDPLPAVKSDCNGGNPKWPA